MRTVYVESHLAHDFWGKVIAYVTRSNVQHSAFVITDEGGMFTYRYEALRSKGFVRTLWHSRERTVLRKINVTEERFAKMVWKAEKMKGTKYPSLVYLGLEYIIPFLNHQLRTAYCSQAIGEILEDGGLYSAKDSLAKPSPGVIDAVAVALSNATA
jgi:hypothetical protein